MALIRASVGQNSGFSSLLKEGIDPDSQPDWRKLLGDCVMFKLPIMKIALKWVVGYICCEWYFW